MGRLDFDDDVISRQAVLDGLASIAKAKAKSDAQKSLMGRIMLFAEQLPSVQPKVEQEPKTGHYKKSLSDGTLLTDTQWKIIHRIDVLYAKGKIFKHIKKPLAWALYQVWKEVAVDIIR